MDRRVTARVNMFNNIKKVCDDNAPIVSSIPAFALLVAELGEIMVGIKILMRKLVENNSGESNQKENTKTALSLQLGMLCGAGQSFGRSLKDIALTEKFHFAESVFFNMRDAVLVETANSLKALMEKYNKELLPYGVDETFIADLNDTLAAFEKVSSTPMVNIYTGEAERKELINLTFNGSDFVFNDLMAVALMYKKKNLTFYNSLVNASRVSKVGIRHDEISEAVADLKKEIATQKKITRSAKKSELEIRMMQERQELQKVLEELQANTVNISQLDEKIV